MTYRRRALARRIEDGDALQGRGFDEAQAQGAVMAGQQLVEVLETGRPVGLIPSAAPGRTHFGPVRPASLRYGRQIG